MLPDDSLELNARNSVLKMMDRTFNRIKTTFTEEQRFNSFINVITNLMDPHTDYYPPVEKRAFDERMSNQFYGIGAQLQQDDNGIKIASIVLDSIECGYHCSFARRRPDSPRRCRASPPAGGAPGAPAAAQSRSPPPRAPPAWSGAGRSRRPPGRRGRRC